MPARWSTTDQRQTEDAKTLQSTGGMVADTRGVYWCHRLRIVHLRAQEILEKRKQRYDPDYMLRMFGHALSLARNDATWIVAAQ